MQGFCLGFRAGRTRLRGMAFSRSSEEAGEPQAPADIRTLPRITPEISYLVCATPRSGSDVLCRVLRQTRVLGQPDEYFYEANEPPSAAARYEDHVADCL